MEIIRMGLLGAGGISQRVTAGIVQSKYCQPVIVCSRDISKAKVLAEKFNIEKYSDNYEDLFNADIDAVYIVTINQMHYQHIKMCLQHRKHVICEKPMLIKKEEIDELYDLADKNNVLLLEAMKCRYLPTVAKIREILKNYPYPNNLYATFIRDEPFAKDYTHSYYDPLYGGTQKDIGCYVYSFALELFPEETVLYDIQTTEQQGIDTEVWLYLKNNKGLFMQLGSSVNYNTDNVAIISGNGYQIKIREFWKTFAIEVYQGKEMVASYQKDIGSEFAYQVDFFATTIKKANWLNVNKREREFLKRIVALNPTSK